MRQRARGELAQIDAVRSKHASRLAVVPLLAEEPIGHEPLQRLVQPGYGIPATA